MDAVKVAIPLFGKMAMRSFHRASLRDILQRHGMSPVYFVASHYIRNGLVNGGDYCELRTDQYEELLRANRLFRALAECRRFAVRTETTDLRFRESIEQLLFRTGSVAAVWSYALAMDLIRRIPELGRVLAWTEGTVFRTHLHDAALRANEIQAVLTPGPGSYGFWNEGFFAREAKRLGLPVFAAITNYDNVVNMGFRGFLPDVLAVWSRAMADEAIRLQKIPAKRIVVTGPVQFDRYFAPLLMSREEFLRSKGLDPGRQTVFYAGGVNISRYFEVFRLLQEARGARPRWNIVVRPWPHPKVLSAPEWKFFEETVLGAGGVYLSNPLKFSSDGLAVDSYRNDVNVDQDLDELTCLLKYSDVLINHFSTISLEAAICDLPAIHIGYDEYTYGYRFNMSVAFQRRQTHNRRPLRLRAARIATSASELVHQIEGYLTDRTLDHEARRAYALAECEYLDGRSSERLAAALQTRLAQVAHR